MNNAVCYVLIHKHEHKSKFLWSCTKASLVTDISVSVTPPVTCVSRGAGLGNNTKHLQGKYGV